MGSNPIVSAISILTLSLLHSRHAQTGVLVRHLRAWRILGPDLVNPSKTVILASTQENGDGRAKAGREEGAT